MFTVLSIQKNRHAELVKKLVPIILKVNLNNTLGFMFLSKIKFIVTAGCTNEL